MNKIALSLFTASIIFLTSPVHAQDMHIDRGVVCDTKAQLQFVLGGIFEGANLEYALAKINDADHPTACSFMNAIFEVAERPAEIMPARGGAYVIWEVNVVRVFSSTDGRSIEVEGEAAQFMAVFRRAPGKAA